MSLRSLMLAGALLLCGSCFWMRGQAPAQDGLSVGDALAQTACPVQVAEASAWVNRMPPIGSRTGHLNVSVRLAGVGDTAILTRSPRSTAETLVLDIRPSDETPIPGRMAYREDAPSPLYRQVEFACRGAAVFRLDEIEEAF